MGFEWGLGFRHSWHVCFCCLTRRRWSHLAGRMNQFSSETMLSVAGKVVFNMLPGSNFCSSAKKMPPLVATLALLLSHDLLELVLHKVYIDPFDSRSGERVPLSRCRHSFPRSIVPESCRFSMTLEIVSLPKCVMSYTRSTTSCMKLMAICFSIVRSREHIHLVGAIEGGWPADVHCKSDSQTLRLGTRTLAFTRTLLHATKSGSSRPNGEKGGDKHFCLTAGPLIGTCQLRQPWWNPSQRCSC